MLTNSEKIRYRLKERSNTWPAKIARELGLSRVYISRMIAGKIECNGPKTKAVAEYIAKAAGSTPGRLWPKNSPLLGSKN